MLLFVLLFAFASAAPVIDRDVSVFPSLTRRAVLPSNTTSVGTITKPTTACDPERQYCERADWPFFDVFYVWPNNSLGVWGIGSPYYNKPGQPQFTPSAECAAAFFVSMTSYLDNAPITFVETLGTTATDAISTTTSSTWVYSTHSTTVVVFTKQAIPTPGETRSEFTVTFETVNNAGVDVLATSTWADVGMTTTTEYYEGPYLHVYTVPVPAHTTTVIDLVTATYATGFTFTAQPPCCSSCTVWAGAKTSAADVEVFFWPKPTAVPIANATITKLANSSAPITTMVNEAGFTFTSPSIYVAFTSLWASDQCGTLGNTEIITATTLAFDATEIMSDNYYLWNTAEYANWEPHIAPAYTTWGEAATKCGLITTSFYQYSYPYPFLGPSATYTEFNNAPYTIVDGVVNQLPPMMQFTVSYDPCLPLIAIPTDVFTLNPSWKSCVQGIAGLRDPPSALSIVTNIGNTPAPTTASSSSTTASPGIFVPTTSPSPSPLPAAPTASNTQTTPPAATASSAVSNPAPANPVAVGNGISSVASAADPVAATPPAIIASIASDPGSTGQDTTNPDITDPDTSGTDPADPANVNKVAAPTPTSLILPVITLGTSTITANSASAFVISSQTLTPGGQITQSPSSPSASPVILSLNSAGNALVIGGSSTQLIQTTTILVPPPLAQTPTPIPTPTPVPGLKTTLLPAALLTFGSSTITENPSRAFVVASQTLTPGGKVTVSGTVLSLEKGNSAVVIGSSTQVLQSTSRVATVSVGLGGVIATVGGFGTATATGVGSQGGGGGEGESVGGGNGSGNGTVQFTGGAERMGLGMGRVIMGLWSLVVVGLNLP